MRIQQTPWRMFAVGAGSLAMICAATNGRTAETEAEAREAKKGERMYAFVAPMKIRHDGDKTYVWAGRQPDSEKDEWFDFTNSPIPAEKLQYGLGKDRIPSIDDPVFVSPDDPRLMQIPASGYRRDERPVEPDDIMVIGYADAGEARAYPTALLDRHELVNDRVGGKPVTVGW